METLNARKINRRSLIVLVALVSLLAAVFGIMSGAAQTPEKEEREVEDKIPKHLPIKVKVKKEKEKKLKDSENDEWLRDVEVEVTNTGTKPIYYMKINLDLPDARADDERGSVYHLYYGRRELIKFDEPVRPDDVSLKPGETVTLGVYDLENEIVSWKHFRAKGTFKNPKKMHFKFQVINFGDGTGFVGPDGGTIPEKRERSSNGRCGGGEEEAETTVSSNSPPRYFTDSAYLPITYLSPPVSFMTAAFVVGNSSPEPSPKRDVCCPVANCPHIKFNQDQGCPCGGLRDIVESAPCSDPQGVCRTIEHKTKTCFVSGVEFNCEESEFGPPCGAPTPTPTPTPELTPTPTPEPCPEPQPDTCCDPHFFAAAPGSPPPPCQWDCSQNAGCPANLSLYGCYVPANGTCPTNYTKVKRPEILNELCCPALGGPGPGPCDEYVECDFNDPIVIEDTICCNSSPILVDVAGDGFHMTDAAGGVVFDLGREGTTTTEKSSALSVRG